MAGVVCTVCGYYDDKHAIDCQYLTKKKVQQPPTQGDSVARSAPVDYTAEGDRLEALSRKQLERLREMGPSAVRGSEHSSVEAVLREHITYLREQLAGKDRWQNEELDRLRVVAVVVTDLRLALQEATDELYAMIQNDEYQASSDAVDRLRGVVRKGL